MDGASLQRLIDSMTREALAQLAADAFRAHPIQPADGAGPAVAIGSAAGRAAPSTTTHMPDVAKLIDHTLLKPDATAEQIRGLCAEARTYQFATVCVNPCWVSLCHELLGVGPVGVASVVGFPLGATTAEAKAFEARQAIDHGAAEIDMVLNIGALKGADYATVARDIAAVAAECHTRGALLKVILETAFLTDDEKTAACELCLAVDADYVKTSTGFGPGGATEADVELMRRVVGSRAGVKAAGGIRTLADAHKMVAAGATRLGASSGAKIVRELLGESVGTPSEGRY